MISTDSKGFYIENLGELNKEHSPSLPMNFPKERLPCKIYKITLTIMIAELCEEALIKMSLCVFQNQSNLCGQENRVYYNCRKERDAQIFTRIKEWEIEEIQKIPEFDKRQSYYDELEIKRAQIAKQFERTPSSMPNKNKRWRMAADIEQLQWRMENIKSFIKPQI
ncbi:UNKNOWN [Stylonychia lemnae]|uniref:Uncharacterized protein n=1 Tax=Stylonychia lemnae TaxID=5949 RepID=A0A078A873_STYLE|nr:UNKNOWN [Stylonychia lemnae]|eukprot:CDW78419.1 UNKNOWN [Stylonychia lemnae]